MIGRVCLVALALAACGDNLDAPIPTGPDPSDPSVPLALVLEEIELEGGAPLAITHLAFIPHTDELLVASKSRTVTHYRLPDGARRATRLGTFDVPGVDETADCGLISIAFDPQFATSRHVYFARCTSPAANRISRHTFDAADYASIARTQTPIYEAALPSATRAWHNIGAMGFDPQGSLWFLQGDKNDPRTAQDPDSPFGKVLRIVPRPAGGFDPDPRNPRGGAIVASGLRSPWRGTLDERGRLWIGDVGEGGFEEVDISHFAGENFGNPIAEGPCTLGAPCEGVTDPVIHWDRSTEHRYAREDPKARETSRRVVWIGATYPRTVATDRYATRLFDRILVGDFAGGWIRAIGLDDAGRVIHDQHVGHVDAATAWDVGPDGYLYVTSYGSDLAWPYVPGSLYRARAVR